MKKNVDRDVDVDVDVVDVDVNMDMDINMDTDVNMSGYRRTDSWPISFFLSYLLA